MKKLIYLCTLLLALVGVTSCSGSHDSEDDTFVTHYITLELKGDATLQHVVGTPYTDPGYKAYIGETDYTDDVVVGGDEVDPNTPGVYNVTYTVTNKDGFPTTTKRQVIVCDPTVTTDISGKWNLDAGTNRDGAEYSGATVTITKVAPGFFAVDDEIGGFYAQIRYGDKPEYFDALSCGGHISLDKDGYIKGIDGVIPNWNTPITSLEGKLNDDGTLVWDCVWSGMNFHVVLTK